MRKTLVLLLMTFKIYAQENIYKDIDRILLKTLKSNNADNGLVIFRNLENNENYYTTAYIRNNNSYIKNYKLAQTPIQPGGFMIPIAAAFLIDQFNLKLSDSIDLEGGKTIINGNTIYDSENHGLRNICLKEIISKSSNVGIAKHFTSQITSDKSLYIFQTSLDNYLSPLSNPITHLSYGITPFISFGSKIKLAPRDILNFYSNIATDKIIFSSNNTTESIKKSLLDVMETGTGKMLNTPGISFSGKTATIQIESNKKKTSFQYYSGFVGYFPSENPKYSCIVIIKCKPNAQKYYGAAVAGPVFRDIMMKAKL